MSTKPGPNYRDQRRRLLARLLLTYLTPLLVAEGYFLVQYRGLVLEGRRNHLVSLSENLATTLDLFLSERVRNLSHIIDDPGFPERPDETDLQDHLSNLRRQSDTYIDLGVFDERGQMVAYAGPYPDLTRQDYSEESWFKELRAGKVGQVVTDIYLGFRQEPHFTLAVSRRRGQQLSVLRATLAPSQVHEYIESLEEAKVVRVALINGHGIYQSANPDLGNPLETSVILPPREPRADSGEDRSGKVYGYAWLHTTAWAVLVDERRSPGEPWLTPQEQRVLLFALLLTLVIIGIIAVRARQVMAVRIETDATTSELSGQLLQASKLASIGELAAGIAHEINNPLASIAEEAGLIRDMLDPRFGDGLVPAELDTRLASIQAEVFRCRDITHKLLRFVRRSDAELASTDLHALIDDLLETLFLRELSVENISIERRFAPELPTITTDANQLRQVLLNMLNNAIDAIEGQGSIVLTTSLVPEGRVALSLADTGKGIPKELLEKIFMPFFTTKEVGKGTGLGLHVSYGIVRNLGGTIAVQSVVGKGTTFIITLPVGEASSPGDRQGGTPCS
ncbi:MAG: hypothetical protein A2284_05590 [Deltaproteobacteria bacterium RIFOXYA12_FULL_61_11]|nr:MAG: hypothetical protein A2284_05590 [Deltaproteobacteria bacterium RIFOXYA12_FULL_61_11]